MLVLTPTPTPRGHKSNKEHSFKTNNIRHFFLDPTSLKIRNSKTYFGLTTNLKLALYSLNEPYFVCDDDTMYEYI